MNSDLLGEEIECTHSNTLSLGTKVKARKIANLKTTTGEQKSTQTDNDNNKKKFEFSAENKIYSGHRIYPFKSYFTKYL
jgi:hypothetical protein